MDDEFLKAHKVSALYEDYYEDLPQRRMRPRSNFVFSAQGSREYRRDEAIQLVTIKTGISKRDVIRLLVKAGHSEIENMAGYDYDYYVALSSLEKDG